MSSSATTLSEQKMSGEKPPWMLGTWTPSVARSTDEFSNISLAVQNGEYAEIEDEQRASSVASTSSRPKRIKSKHYRNRNSPISSPKKKENYTRANVQQLKQVSCFYSHFFMLLNLLL